jgi:Branched-chain amino acid ATP-binding cassette transporter
VQNDPEVIRAYLGTEASVPQTGAP